MGANNLYSMDTITVPVKAVAARTTDLPYAEAGLIGVAAQTAAINTYYPLHVGGEFRFTLAGCSVGSQVYIDGSNALTLTASTNKKFGVVTQIPVADINDLTGNDVLIRINAPILGT
jgi:hypothetical protein